jgi:hypothetical protein
MEKHARPSSKSLEKYLVFYYLDGPEQDLWSELIRCKLGLLRGRRTHLKASHADSVPLQQAPRAARHSEKKSFSL